jgi:peptide/nickel transport system substrate-binding protein
MPTRSKIVAATISACIATAALGAGAPRDALAAPKTSVTIGMSVEPTGLDPTIAAPVAIGQVTWQNIFEGLTTIDRDGQVQPQLAESWEISEDGLTYTFKLRTGVTSMTAKPSIHPSPSLRSSGARGEDSVNPQKRYLATVESVETPNAQTLVLKLSKPTGSPSLLAGMAVLQHGWHPLSREQQDDADWHWSVQVRQLG